jgi:hypothetical protein
MNSALTAALELAREGKPCFPCLENKAPACPGGFKSATTNIPELRDLFCRYPGSKVGVVTGETSGFDVFDVDLAKHPEASEWWAKNRRRIPPTRIHRTRSGGIHVLFQHAADLRCWAARPVKGTDGRASGGYIVWWPAAGCPVVRNDPPAPWPEWFLREAAPPRPAPIASPTPIVVEDRYVAAALRHAVERVSRAGEGQRNATLNSEAYSLTRFVAGGVLPAQQVADALAAAGIDAGLNPREVALTLRSAFRARGLA